MLKRSIAVTNVVSFLLFVLTDHAVGGAAWTAGSGVAAAGSQAACPVTYSPLDSSTAPLLFGGVEDSCSTGCQPRDGSVWSKACKRDPASPTWGLCLPQQRRQLLGFLKQQVQQGAVDASILSLHPCQLYEMLAGEGRTLWLIGDSHIKQIYAAMRCFMSDFWQHAEGECAASSTKALQAQLDDVTAEGHQYRTAPRCLHLIGGTGARICLVHSPKGDMFFSDNPQGIGTLQLLKSSFAAPQDIIYISVGRWHANNCEGVGSQLASIFTQIGHFAQDNAETLPNIFFSPSPFDHVECGPNKTLLLPPSGICVPPSEGNYSMAVWQEVVRTAHQILADTYNVTLIDTYSWTVPLHWAHISLVGGGWDCLHYCRPGLSEIEIWHMFNAIQSRGLRSGVPTSSSNLPTSSRVCMPVAMQLSRAGNPPLVPLDRDDLGYLMPPAPAVV